LFDVRPDALQRLRMMCQDFPEIVHPVCLARCHDVVVNGFDSGGRFVIFDGMLCHGFLDSVVKIIVARAILARVRPVSLRIDYASAAVAESSKVQTANGYSAFLPLGQSS
jgi:hypothetical protein